MNLKSFTFLELHAHAMELADLTANNISDLEAEAALDAALLELSQREAEASLAAL